jgi:hypothetical protein
MDPQDWHPLPAPKPDGLSTTLAGDRTHIQYLLLPCEQASLLILQ